MAEARHYQGLRLKIVRNTFSKEWRGEEHSAFRQKKGDDEPATFSF
jgi:hypothetical protein